MPLMPPATGERTAARMELARSSLIVEIGGMPIELRTTDEKFQRVIEDRYAGLLNPNAAPALRFEMN